MKAMISAILACFLLFSCSSQDRLIGSSPTQPAELGTSSPEADSNEPGVIDGHVKNYDIWPLDGELDGKGGGG